MNQNRTREQAMQLLNTGLRVPPIGAGKQAVVYVSAIDAVTPLTVAAARRLAFAKAEVELLTQFGFQVRCHGLFADYGDSVNNLVLSIWLRYLELCGEEVPHIEGCYQGDYIFDFAATVHRNFGNRLAVAASEVTAVLTAGGDRFARMRSWLGDEALSTIKQIGLQGINRDIASDLQQIGLTVSHWQQTSALAGTSALKAGIRQLESAGLVQTEAGVLYLNLPGTPKILLHTETSPTLFALQLADFLVFAKDCKDSDLNICIFDIDQGNEIKRFQQCAQRLGFPIVLLEKPILSPQLFESGELVHTSPLAEDFVSFREVRQTVGWHDLLWQFAVHRSDEAIRIDLSGGHAAGHTICDGLFQSATNDAQIELADLTQILMANKPQDLQAILKIIAEFPITVDRASRVLEPAFIVIYYRKLCESILTYYNNHQLEVSEAGQTASSVVTAIITKIQGLTDITQQLTGLNN